ncbi:MAG: tetratricopeptide repeat protein [Deltaproteobacteria bacterium]|nr:tetratricopeptide repeat protein [Deltaproteobacteria bacterium]
MANVSRKELLKPEDAFLVAAAQSAKWLTAHRTPLVAGSIAVVAAILGTWGVVEYVRSRDRGASEMFETAMQVLDAEVLAAGATEQPAPEDADNPKFATEADKRKAVRDRFQKVVDEKGGSGVADLSLFFVADANQKLGDNALALKQFTQIADRLSPTDSLFFLAVERAAYLQEAAGDKDAALKSLGRLANTEGGFYRDYATFHQARLYLAKGDVDRARNLFEHIEKTFPESSVAEKARDRLAELGPAKPADTGAAATPAAKPEADQAP